MILIDKKPCVYLIIDIWSFRIQSHKETKKETSKEEKTNLASMNEGHFTLISAVSSYVNPKQLDEINDQIDMFATASYWR